MADYTAPHESSSDSKKHATYRGDYHTVHAYDDGSGEFKPFPMGNHDKWFAKKKEGS